MIPDTYSNLKSLTKVMVDFVFEESSSRPMCALCSKVQSVLLLDFQVKAKSIINKIDPTLVEETLKF